ncbi:zinc-dependent alcohol dehydrogenase [Burkholderia sp. TSV86]|uniref:zinc-dependent alcohol dehydrogenase n=1 Tax=Burkholderia sp. TSV86 TaxID=1385594 RepID=UPI0009E6FF81|nr:zinc-dependent alcohol dehydrogenase [Burkholderia sp. TSV86]
MSHLMRAAVAEQFNQPLSICDVPIPSPAPDQVLVRLAASGVCHTDIHAVRAEWPLKPRLPLIPGHEAVGFISACGENVKHLREGDRVGVFWLNSACGICEFCTSKRETLCLKQKNTGYSLNGTFAEYCVVSGDYAVPLPQGDPYKLAPIMCAGVTTYKGIKETGVKPGEWIAISGVGGIGHLAVQYAKALGLQVVALDIDDDRLRLATQLGADIVVNAQTEFPVSRVTRVTGGVHGALITAVSPKAFEQGLGMLRRGGTCVLVGIPPGSFALSIFDTVVKGLTTRGSIIGSRQDLKEALEFVSSGSVSAQIEVRPLNMVNQAIDAILQRQIRGRIVLDLN